MAIHGKSPTAIDLLPQKLGQEGFSVRTASSKKSKFFRLMEMVFTTIQNRNWAQLVLIDTYSTQNFYYAVLVAKLCRVFKLPYIPIVHGGNLPLRLKNSKNLSRKLFGKAQTIVAPSTYMMEQFKSYGFEKMVCIPNNIQIVEYPFKLRKSVTPKLLWVRSFSEIYNPLLALEIVEILQKKGVGVSLTMVGPDKDGSLQHCKKLAAERNLPITFTGMLQKQEWIKLSENFSVFINTTNFDNMPVSVMEAMAVGLPVISTNVGGLSFLIENEKEGILVPPNNAEAFVEAIESIIKNPIMTQKLTENARKKIESYDWEKVKQAWIKLLDA